MNFSSTSNSAFAAFITYISPHSPGETVRVHTALKHGYITSPKSGASSPFPAARAEDAVYFTPFPPASLNAKNLSPPSALDRLVTYTPSSRFSLDTNISAYTGCEEYSSSSTMARRSKYDTSYVTTDWVLFFMVSFLISPGIPLSKKTFSLQHSSSFSYSAHSAV